MSCVLDIINQIGRIEEVRVLLCELEFYMYRDLDNFFRIVSSFYMFSVSYFLVSRGSENDQLPFLSFG
jgi:hypothetical protein